MLDTEMVTRTLIVEEGHIEARSILLEEIYVPKEDETDGNNVTRYELNMNHVTNLQVALHYPDWSMTLMIVKEIKGGKEINGKTYYYQLVAGFHRFEALSNNVTLEWLFDVYDFTGNPELESIIQALENDHKPQLVMTKAGLTNWLKHQVEKGFIGNTEADMNKAVEVFKFVASIVKTNAVKAAVNETGAYKDVTIRSIKEIKLFLDNPDNYCDDNRSMYSHSGNLDPHRLEHGWTVKEGYEHEYLFNAMRRFHNTGRTSYFINHVFVPKTGTVDDSRQKMMDKFDDLEDALKSAVLYKKKNGTWPWRTEAFFKQDNHPQNRETYWVTLP
jgi:hypothetical protein